MKSIPIPEILQNEDEETIDEYDYDDSSVELFLTKVYQETKEYPIFIELYEKAAGLMFSTNPEIGLAILLSYDYFCFFFPFYKEIIQNINHPHSKHFSENIHYKKLVEKLFT
jgi:hypothetical protein